MCPRQFFTIEGRSSGSSDNKTVLLFYQYGRLYPPRGVPRRDRVGFGVEDSLWIVPYYLCRVQWITTSTLVRKQHSFSVSLTTRTTLDVY